MQLTSFLPLLSLFALQAHTFPFRGLFDSFLFYFLNRDYGAFPVSTNPLGYPFRALGVALWRIGDAGHLSGYPVEITVLFFKSPVALHVFFPSPDALLLFFSFFLI